MKTQPDTSLGLATAGTTSAAQLLAFLSEEESRTFFPNEGLAEGWDLPVNCTQINPVGLDSVEAIIREVKPDVIMGAWSTPMLPLIDGKLPAPYYCHVCGSVRQQVSCRMLEDGLLVSNWGSTIATVVAETALMLALAAQRNLTHHFYAIHLERAWRSESTRPQGTLDGARMGIHGLGLIGRELCRMLKPFHPQLSATDPYQSDVAFTQSGAKRVQTVEELYRDNDIIFVCCALTDETHGIITRELLESMRPGSVFINVARGKLVDQAALVDLLKRGHLSAGLDVYDNEPLAADSPLRGLRNLVATPHIGGYTNNARREAGQLARANITRFLMGEPVTNVVSLAQFYMMT